MPGELVRSEVLQSLAEASNLRLMDAARETNYRASKNTRRTQALPLRTHGRRWAGTVSLYEGVVSRDTAYQHRSQVLHCGRPQHITNFTSQVPVLRCPFTFPWLHRHGRPPHVSCWSAPITVFLEKFPRRVGLLAHSLGRLLWFCGPADRPGLQVLALTPRGLGSPGPALLSLRTSSDSCLQSSLLRLGLTICLPRMLHGRLTTGLARTHAGHRHCRYARTGDDGLGHRNSDDETEVKAPADAPPPSADQAATGSVKQPGEHPLQNYLARFVSIIGLFCLVTTGIVLSVGNIEDGDTADNPVDLTQNLHFTPTSPTITGNPQMEPIGPEKLERFLYIAMIAGLLWMVVALCCPNLLIVQTINHQACLGELDKSVLHLLGATLIFAVGAAFLPLINFVAFLTTLPFQVCSARCSA
ncbi:hypothetical protein Bbelb_375090 [Branchiostoma belcheri]|nr:hypothetical protein Bbelb_375090 [Branchiostoma belcheri]